MRLSTYEDWKHCITEICGIPLTPEYVEKRISELNNPKDFKTQKFIDQWGEAHLSNVIRWFEQAREEFKS